MPFTQCSTHAVDLVQLISCCADTLTEVAGADPATAATQTLWHMMQSEASIAEQARLKLQASVSWWARYMESQRERELDAETKDVRDLLIQCCLQNLQQKHSVPQSMQLLSHIVSTFADGSSGQHAGQAISSAEPTAKPADVDVTMADATEVRPLQRTRVSVLKDLGTRHQLLDLYFAELSSFKARSGTQGDAEQCDELRARLEFLDGILRCSNGELLLSEQQLFQLWQHLVIDVTSPTEREIAFEWLWASCMRGCDSPPLLPTTEPRAAAMRASSAGRPAGG